MLASLLMFPCLGYVNAMEALLKEWFFFKVRIFCSLRRACYYQLDSIEIIFSQTSFFIIYLFLEHLKF